MYHTSSYSKDEQQQTQASNRTYMCSLVKKSNTGALEVATLTLRCEEPAAARREVHSSLQYFANSILLVLTDGNSGWCFRKPTQKWTSSVYSSIVIIALNMTSQLYFFGNTIFNSVTVQWCNAASVMVTIISFFLLCLGRETLLKTKGKKRSGYAPNYTKGKSWPCETTQHTHTSVQKKQS